MIMAAAVFFAACAVFLLLGLALRCGYVFFLARLRQDVIPTEWPLVGMLPSLLYNLRDFHGWMIAIHEAARGNFHFRGPPGSGFSFLLTGDPANVRHVFNTSFANYPKGNDYGEIFDILGGGIFNADGESWHRQRIKAQLLFARPRFRAFVSRATKEKVEGGVLPLLSRFAESSPAAAFDLQDVFLRLTFDMTMRLVFGVDPSSLSPEMPAVPFAQAMDDAMATLFLRHIVPPAWWKLLRLLNVGPERKLVIARRVIDEFIATTIANRKTEECQDADDLLSSYIGKGEESELGTFLRDTTLSFMVAGRDTTGTALSWIFYLLAMNPGINAKLIQELKAIAPAETAAFDDGSLNKLVYLTAVILEGLRLYPPVPFEHKMAVERDMLPSGHAVAPGGKILFSLYSMGRSRKIWGEDSDRFRPERWISAVDGKLRYEPSYRFVAFNAGPRTCLGKEIAMTQLRAVVAAVAWNFCVEVVPGQAVEPKLSIILHMKNGLMVKVKKRVVPPIN